MKLKFKILSLVLLLAVAHGVAQNVLAAAVRTITGDHMTLFRATSAALHVSERPLGAIWSHAGGSIWLPAANSLLWAIGLTGLIGLALRGAQKTGLIRSDTDPFWRRLLKVRRLLLSHEAFVPVVALGFASLASVGLVLARIIWTGNLLNSFLVWNLFLAWMPLGFALLAREHYLKAGHRNWTILGLALAWLLFFPNAPYIFTDVIHLTRGLDHHFWVDLTLILICALTGFVVGFVSLYLMQSLVARVYGRAAGWLFIAVTAGLSGFGIYLGRFVRLNSWDVVVRPTKVYHVLNAWVADPMANINTFLFPALFAVFLFLAYVMLYALTHLQQAQNLAGPVNAVKLAEA